MVFKRYIYKHGKKLGPYYYENVRTSDGRVKTIYIGTNPQHHPHHIIRKPLFFLIMVLLLILILGGSLFLFQNKAYVAKKVGLQEPDFEVDQVLLKVLIRSNEFLEKQIRIMNIGNKEAAISIEASGISDLIRLDSNSFTLKPGQTKVVTLNFSSFIEEQKIEQQPGVYVGKLIVRSDKASKEIPIVIEIETRNVLFDMNLNPVAIERKVNQGSDTTIEVRLFNLESIDSVNVDVEYFVKDMNSNTIVTETETVVVKTQASFFKTISIPKNLRPGAYVFAALTKFGNSIGTSSYLFDVIGPEEQSFVQLCKNNVLCLGLSLATILLLFALTAYFYFFIGAYIYEKVSGAITFPRKRKETEAEAEAEGEIVEAPSMLDRIKLRLDEWKQERQLKKAEEERLEREEELQRLAEERIAQQQAKRAEMEEQRRQLEELRISEQSRKQKELEAKRLEEQEQIRKAEKERQLRGRKHKLKDFFHKISLYEARELRKEHYAMSYKLKKFHTILSNLKEALEKDLDKAKKLYLKARKHYIELENHEKRAVYSEFSELHQKLHQFIKNIELKEEIKRLEERQRARAKQEEEQRKKAEGERLLQERKHKLKDFFHKIGLRASREIREERKAISYNLKRFYNSLEELKEALEKDIDKAKLSYLKARKHYIALENHEKKAVYHEFSQLHQRLSGLIKEIERKRELKEIEEREKSRAKEEQEQIKKAEKERQLRERKHNLKDFFHRLGLYKTPEEKQQIALQKEKEKQEKQRKKEEAKLLSDLEQKQKIQQQKFKEEAKEKQIKKKKAPEKQKPIALELETEIFKDEAIRKPEEKKSWFQRLLGKKEPELKLELKQPEEETIAKEKKPSIFGGIFGKELPKEVRQEKTQLEKQKPKGEFEELEQAIKSLDLFKKVEEVKSEVPKKNIFEKLFEKEESEAEVAAEELKEPSEMALKSKKQSERLVKSKKIMKCQSMLDDVKKSIASKKITKAKKIYAQARKLYVGLSQQEKKELYGELTDLYNKLIK